MPLIGSSSFSYFLFSTSGVGLGARQVAYEHIERPRLLPRRKEVSTKKRELSDEIRNATESLHYSNKEGSK